MSFISFISLFFNIIANSSLKSSNLKSLNFNPIVSANIFKSISFPPNFISNSPLIKLNISPLISFPKSNLFNFNPSNTCSLQIDSLSSLSCTSVKSFIPNSKANSFNFIRSTLSTFANSNIFALNTLKLRAFKSALSKPKSLTNSLISSIFMSFNSFPSIFNISRNFIFIISNLISFNSISVNFKSSSLTILFNNVRSFKSLISIFFMSNISTSNIFNKVSSNAFVSRAFISTLSNFQSLIRVLSSALVISLILANSTNFISSKAVFISLNCLGDNSKPKLSARAF